MLDPMTPLIARVHRAREGVRVARHRYGQCSQTPATACTCELHRARRELAEALSELQEALATPHLDGQAAPAAELGAPTT